MARGPVGVARLPVGAFFAAVLVLTLYALHASALASPVSLPGRGLALCGDWLVTDTSIVHLPTGESLPLYEPAEEALCTHGYIVAVGGTTVMVYKPPRLVTVYKLGNRTFVGASGPAVLLYDPAMSRFILETPSSAVLLPAPYRPEQAAFAIIDGLPVVAYSARLPNGTVAYIVSSIGGWNVAGEGTGGVYLDENGTVILATELGLTVGRLDPEELTVYANYTVLVPVPVESIARVEWPLVYAYTPSGDVVVVDMDRRTWRLLGRFTVTPVGFYDDYADATLVPTRDGYVKVLGYAFAAAGGVILSTYNGSVALYPLEPSVLHLRRAAAATLLTRELSVRVQLPPGDYLVPRGSVLLVDDTAVPVSKPEVWWPESERKTSKSIVTISYTPTAMVWPEAPLPIDAIHGVDGVYAGSGRLLVIRGTDAIVYTKWGSSLTIPGRWSWGVLGADCLALYDGVAIHVYDYGGKRLAVYGAYSLPAPLAGWCSLGARGPEVHLVYREHSVAIDAGGARVVPGSVYRDPVSGAELDYAAGVLRYAGVEVQVPPGAQLNAWQAWWVENSTLYILDLQDGKLYALLGAPDARLYPLGDVLAVLDNESLTVYPFKAWFSGCWVHIDTLSEAEVYVDGRLVSRGPVTVYAPCGQQLQIVARMPWREPASTTVVVQPGGVYARLYPKPIYTNVTVQVVAPKGLNVTMVKLAVDGRTYTVKPGGSIRVEAMPHRLAVLEVQPDVCKPEPRAIGNWTPRAPRDVLVIRCVLESPVLALHSNVTVNAYIYRPGSRTPLSIRQVEASVTVYVALPAGEYTIESRPLVDGYAPRTLNVTLPEGAVVHVDVTPLPLPRLIVNAFPPTASIQVKAANGTVVAEGRGRLDTLLYPGSYTVVVTAPGYATSTIPVELGPGQVASFNVTLSPLPPPARPKPAPWWENPVYQATAAAAVAAAAAAAVIWRRRRRGAPEVEEGAGPGAQRATGSGG